MVAQAARVGELLSAHRAAVLLGAGVCAAHVFLHVVKSGEGLSADEADVLSGVDSTVVGVLAASEEPLAAGGAVVALLAGMVAPVLQQFAGREKLFGTHVTDEAPLASVLASMFGDRPMPGKPASADVTVERAVTCMGPTMFGVLLPAQERLSAVIANVDHPLSSGNRHHRLACLAFTATKSLNTLGHILEWMIVIGG